jgi:hypothetical protein
MTRNTNELRYKVVQRDVLVDNLSLEEALYYIDNMRDNGVENLEMVEYFPDANRLGRNPDLH